MMPDWAVRLPWNIITSSARSAGMDPKLVGSIVMGETGGSSWKARYEPDYRYLFEVQRFADSCGITSDTETVQQKTSWGLMQVMGGVARELGFQGDLPELSRPSFGLRFGCLKLRKIFDKYGMQAVHEAVAAYNAGSPRRTPTGEFVNQKYVTKVMRYYQEIGG